MALAAAGIPYVLAGAWETARAPSLVLKKSYKGQEGALHLGDEGDVMSVARDDVPSADALVSGAPCPPWSSMGPMKGWADIRARVFLHILEWIRSLCRRGLKFFILENVAGLRNRSRGKQHSPLDRILRMLHRMLPKGWALKVFDADSSCVAQSRRRIYILGCRRSVPHLSGALRALPRQYIGDILLPGLPNEDIGDLPPTQRLKYKRYLQLLKPFLSDSKFLGTFAVFEAIRVTLHICILHVTHYNV